MKSDKENQFLLLSLYLDDEASPAERQQVELWLKHDAQFRTCYAQQVALRRKLRELPTPAPQVAPEVFADQVLQVIERRSRQKRRYMLGLGALSAGTIALVGALLSLASSARSPEFSTAQQTVAPKTEPLMIAMERPVVPLPNALTQP